MSQITYSSSRILHPKQSEQEAVIADSKEHVLTNQRCAFGLKTETGHANHSTAFLREECSRDRAPCC